MRPLRSGKLLRRFALGVFVVALVASTPAQSVRGLPNAARHCWYRSGAIVAGCVATFDAAAPDRRDISLLNEAGEVVGSIRGLEFGAGDPSARSRPFQTVRWIEPPEPAAGMQSERSMLLRGDTDVAAAIARAAGKAGWSVERSDVEQGRAGWLVDASLSGGLDAAALAAAFAATARREAETPGRGHRPTLVVTAGAVCVGRTGSEAGPLLPNPAQAAVWGAVKSCMDELPDLGLCLVDVDPAALDDSANGLISALATGLPRQSAIRGGMVWIPRFEPLALSSGPAFRARGTYLVTGGMGGVGPHLAEWLLAAGARRVVLSGPRRHARTAARLDAAGSLGQGVELAAADATCQSQMAAVIDRLDDLAGVFHCALRLEDRILTRLDEAAFRKVIAPKLDGASVLDRLTRSRDLDHFVVLSSVSGVLGAPGQANYAAASAATDALVEARRLAGHRATAIAFGPWRYPGSPSTGWSATDRVETVEVDEGLARIGHILSSDAPPLVIAARISPEAHAAWRTRVSRTCGGRTPCQEPLLAEKVLGLLARRLHLAPADVPADRSLAALGFDSLAVLELRNALGDELGLYVSPRSLVTAPSMAAVIDAFVAEAATATGLPGQKAVQPTLTSSDVDRLSDWEVEAALASLLTNEGPAA